VLRPSGTLHVFEADSLVLSRAYTFGPAIYPDTPLDVPMKLASVSKSITAAAVVRELDARSIPLTESFVTAAGISGVPASMESVTVLDTLRALGGFPAEADGYADHWIVADSPFGTIPIDGQEMFDHAILGGHLNTGHSDSYWDSTLFWQSQRSGEMLYSNIGYSMLGELVRLSAEAPYDDYVVDNLFAPLGLESRFFADPGHRRCQRGVTLAGRRAYLVNGGHPYNADSIRPMSPRFGTEPLPSPMKGDNSMVWASNAGPIDPAAPAHASLGRYSGEFYMGGGPLAAGGWHADGEALGLLIRELNQGSRLMPAAVAGQLWNPQWWNRLGSPVLDWSYGLGWYARGNWVAWAGGADGSMATVLHNRVHDFTVVYLTNTAGNGLDEFMNPLMQTKGGWNSSAVGAVFSCRDEIATEQNECETPLSVPY
jgi:CubicO group peptidase (beta-lactamase class C family)